MKKNIDKILFFLGITFLISWIIPVGFYVLFGKPVGVTFYAISIIVMFTPSISAIIVQKAIFKEKIKDLGISFKLNGWFPVAWLLPLLMTLGVVLVSMILYPESLNPSGLNYETLLNISKGMFSEEQYSEIVTQMESTAPPLPLMILAMMISGITINAIAGFGEELGWRGLIFKEFSPFGFWKCSITTGFIWGIWHAPHILLFNYNYPDNTALGFFVWIIFTILFSIIFHYIRIKSGSVITSAILHGTFNSIAMVSYVFFRRIDMLRTSMLGISGIIVLIILIFIMLFYDRFFTRDSIIFQKKE